MFIKTTVNLTNMFIKTTVNLTNTFVASIMQPFPDPEDFLNLSWENEKLFKMRAISHFPTMFLNFHQNYTSDVTAFFCTYDKGGKKNKVF